MKALSIFLLITFLCGCINTGRYRHRSDSAPSNVPSELQLDSAQPHYVEYTEANSRPYTVFGKEYFPMQSAVGYEAEGEASWYGQKFHGHLTANGEIYNMYHMTAAHRTLPLPSFVRVTNTDNGLSTIVRVNDRGPFHDNRLIDLSWAAAKKLDIIKDGTAHVKLQVIHVDKNGLVTIGKGPDAELQAPPQEIQQTAIVHQYPGQHITSPKVADSGTDKDAQIENPTQNVQLNGEDKSETATFIQVATLSNTQKVEELARGLSFLFHLPAHTPKTDAGTQIRLGPIQDGIDIQEILKQLREKGFGDAFTIIGPR